MLDFIKIKNLYASKTSSIKWEKKKHQKKGERKIICLLRVWHPAYIKKSCNSTVETNNSIKNGQRRRTRRLTLHDFKTQYEATGIETASYW